MRYIADTTEFQITEPTIVTLGKFDGRHRGHQKLLRAMKDLKGKTGWATAIFTFSIAPAAVMKAGNGDHYQPGTPPEHGKDGY